MLDVLIQAIASQAGIAILVLMFVCVGQAMFLVWVIKSHKEDWKEARGEDRATAQALTAAITELRLEAARRGP